MFNSLNVPLHYAGFVSMIISGGTVISNIFSERIIRRFGTGIVTVASVFMAAAALFGFSFSHSFFCYCSIEMTAGLWGASYLVMEKGISPEIAAQWIVLYYCRVFL
jgi:fucose permease